MLTAEQPFEYHRDWPSFPFRNLDSPNAPKDIVCKSGRSTGVTNGSVNSPIEAHIVHEVDIRSPTGSKTIITWEHAIANIGPIPFSLPGDSGSFVCNTTQRVVGMIFGGSDRTGTSYYTPIGDIFADIKRVTGARDVRIFEG